MVPPFDVHVTFRGGWLSEYYPDAEARAPGIDAAIRIGFSPSAGRTIECKDLERGFGHLRPEANGELQWKGLAARRGWRRPCKTNEKWLARATRRAGGHAGDRQRRAGKISLLSRGGLRRRRFARRAGRSSPKHRRDPRCGFQFDRLIESYRRRVAGRGPGRWSLRLPFAGRIASDSPTARHGARATPPDFSEEHLGFLQTESHARPW